MRSNEDLDDNIKNSLIARLNNAAQQRDAGKYSTAVNEISAFMDEVEAQRDKKISDETADLLIAYAQTIIDHFGAQ